MTKRKHILALLLFLIPSLSAFSQRRLLEFAPGPKSLGLGQSGVVDVYDPSALYWNPASLAALRSSQGMVAVHDPFLMNFAGYAQYLPMRGAFAVNFAKTDQTKDAIKMASFGMGFRLGRHFQTGVSLSGLQLRDEGWTTLGVGFLFKPESSPVAAINKAGGILSSRFIADRLAIGLCVQNIPLVVSDYDHQIRLGASYSFSKFGPKINYAHHFHRDKDTSHYGISVLASEHFNLFAGAEYYDADSLSFAFGAGLKISNLAFNMAYDTELKRVVFSAAIRIGTEPDRLAEQNVERARKLMNTGDKRAALVEGEKALLLNPKNKRALELVRTVFPIVKAEDDKVDSLLQMGKESEQKRWFINAASEYLQVLKLDPDNVRAKMAIKRIRNEVNVHAEKYFQIGVKYFNDGKIEFAKNIFSAIASVRPEHKGTQEYLKKIRGIYAKEAEDHYYTGLGYFSQRNYDKAEEEFRAALDIVPQYNDAQKYLDRIDEARKQNRSQIATLLADAERFERRGSLRSAQVRYQKALNIEPGDPLVMQKLNVLNKRINVYIKNQYRRGEREYRNQNYKSAAKFFRAVLAIEPGHRGARRYLRLISKASHGKSNAYVDRARQEISAGHLQQAIAILDSALSVNPNLKEAKDLKNQTIMRLNSSQLIENAKSQYLSGHYLDALETFNQILKNDPSNQDAQDYRKLCQSKLNDKVDDFFNRGIRFYTEEKYQLAIDEWNKALKINPYHKGSLEYKKRAQDRLEALNRFK